jgi:ABC-type multidrug transport system permease subunit
MVSDTLASPAVRAFRRASPYRLVAALTGHALRSFFRTPVAAFFTLVFPLVFLVIVGAIVGTDVVDAERGIRVAQFLVPPFAVFGVAEAAFCVLATDTALLRENGVLKRLRGTPTPAWIVLAGRIASAVVVSLLSVAVLVGVGVTAYGVDIVWHKIPAALVTLVVGIACFAALGLALVALTRTSLAAQTLSNGLLIPLAFISNVFVVGAKLPTALDWIGRALPLRHFADALAETFNPMHPGSGFSGADLAVMAGWAVAAAVVARWRFSWEPRQSRRGPAPETSPAVAGRIGGAVRALQPGRPSPPALLRIQGGYALTGLSRDPLSVFFAAVFPVLLLLLFPVLFRDFQIQGMRLVDYLVPGMITYAAAVTSYVNTPESIAQARERGVLKRLRGAPLPPWAYLGGRVAAALVVSIATATALVAVASIVYDYRLDPTRLPAALLAFLLGLACFTALGFALVTLVPSAQSLTAVSLGTLLPLSFVSDVFLVGGELPRALQLVGDVFPLKHVARALQAALRPDSIGAGIAWGHLAVIAAWTVAGVLVASRMSWEPHSQ